MFSLPTIPKLLLVFAIIAVVWYFFRRMQSVKHREGNSGGKATGPTAQKGPQNAKPIEDMVQCRSCGAYFPAKSTCSCGRS